LTDPKWHGGDPRRALAFYVGECITAAKRQIALFEDILDETFHVMLIPFIRDFLPAGATLTTTNGIETARPLRLLLTRSTANLLSNAAVSNRAGKAIGVRSGMPGIRHLFRSSDGLSVLF
jgi:hypothetical protein